MPLIERKAPTQWLTKEALDLSLAIRPLLAGHSPEVQGAALADLLSLFLAGHHPTLRAEIFKLHIQAVEELLPESEREMFGDAGYPDALQ